jgi:hypothetical protein
LHHDNNLAGVVDVVFGDKPSIDLATRLSCASSVLAKISFLAYAFRFPLVKDITDLLSNQMLGVLIPAWGFVL